MSSISALKSAAKSSLPLFSNICSSKVSLPLFSNIYSSKDPYFNFPLKKECDILIYKGIHEKEYQCMTPFVNASQTMTIKCRKDHTFDWFSIRALIPCDNCAICWDETSTPVVERLNQIIKSRNGVLKSEYVKPEQKVEIECKDGHRFPLTPRIIIEGAWCRTCSGITPSTAELKLEKIVASKNAELLSPYIHSKTLVAIFCAQNHEFEAKAGYVNFGGWCTQCTGSFKRCPKKAEAKFIEAVRGHNGIIKGDYIKSKQPVVLICKAGHEFKITPNSISKGSWCRKCADKCPEQTKERFQKIIADRKATMIDTYVNTKTLVEIRCASNHTFYLSYKNVYDGGWCPYCTGKGSLGERRVRECLLNLNIKCEDQISFDWLPNKWYDFVFEHNGKSYILEYDGEQHFQQCTLFHPTLAIFNDKREVDILKTGEALKHDYHVIRIAHLDIHNVETIIRDTIIDSKPNQSKLFFSRIPIYQWIIDGLKQDFNIDYLKI